MVAASAITHGYWTFSKNTTYSILLEHLQRGISDLEMDDAAAAPEEAYPAEDAGKDENI